MLTPSWILGLFVFHHSSNATSKMKKTIILWTLLLTFAQLVLGQDPIVSGPMVGYAGMREVMLWVQTNGAAQVQFEYSDGENAFRTAIYTTNAPEAFTAHLIADQVKPGKDYTYKVFINGEEVARDYSLRFKTPPLWQWREDPPEMKIALGSCVYVNDEVYDRPGNPYGGEYEIFTELNSEEPDMMLWLGDNTYLREADWYTRTGIIHRYTHTRALPEMQPLLASTSNYAIWDDHDYGPNNSDYTWINKDLTFEAFRLFWANPTYGVSRDVTGAVTMFEWGDAQFFMLDNRYHRTPNDKVTSERTVLGEAQLQWIVDALVSSSAKWKFVCIGGQVLNTVAQFENYSYLAPQEREFLIESIAREGIRNVVFLTGDRHHSELSMMERYGISIYDFTVSPLTSGSYNAEDEANELRVAGSQVGIRNYGIIEITGERTDRTLTLYLKDSKGEELWKYEIAEQKE